MADRFWGPFLKLETLQNGVGGRHSASRNLFLLQPGTKHRARIFDAYLTGAFLLFSLLIATTSWGFPFLRASGSLISIFKRCRVNRSAYRFLFELLIRLILSFCLLEFKLNFTYNVTCVTCVVAKLEKSEFLFLQVYSSPTFVVSSA